MIHDISPVNNYVGNSSTTTFDFDFYIDNNSQLEVYLYDEYDAKTKLTEDIDYTIHEIRNENGSYITFPIEGSQYDILNENQKISLVLNLPISQETEYNNSSLLNLNSIEYSLDYLTRLIQILSRKIQLCVKVEEISDILPGELMDTIKTKAKEVAEIRSTIGAWLETIRTYTSENTATYQNIAQYQSQFDSIQTIQNYLSTIEDTFLEADGSNISTDFYTNFITNITTSSKDYFSEIGLPDYTATASGFLFKQNYTATTNGWVEGALSGSSNQGENYYTIKDSEGNIVNKGLLAGSASSSINIYFMIFVPKNYTVYFNIFTNPMFYPNGSASNYSRGLKFIPAI